MCPLLSNNCNDESFMDYFFSCYEQLYLLMANFLAPYRKCSAIQCHYYLNENK